MPVIQRNRPTTIKFFLYALIFVVLISLTAVFLRHRNITQPSPAPSGNSKASLSLDRISHSATRDGVRQWSLEAAAAEYYNDENRADLRDISVTFFTKDGKNALLTADTGTLNTITNDMVVSQNVVVTKEDYMVQSEKINYSHNEKLLFTNVPVTISQGESTILADSMTISLEHDTLKLKGNVKGQFSEGLRL